MSIDLSKYAVSICKNVSGIVLLQESFIDVMHTPISINTVGQISGICDQKGLLEARKAPFSGLKSKFIVNTCLYICIFTCCELQTGK